ncbi:MAG: YihY/virulence factor BrkB family protein [Chitinophagaceae bacterium]
MRALWQLMKETWNGISNDKIPRLAASLAYYTVFSMGPLLVVIISLCGLFLKREAIEGKIYSMLQDFVGNDTAIQLQDIIRHASLSGKSTIAIIIGAIALFVGATSVFSQIQDAINSIWGLKPKPGKNLIKLLRNRFLSFSVIISLGFLLLVSLAFSAIIESLSNRLKIHYADASVILFYIINLVLTFGICLLIFAVIFKVLPDAVIRWKDVLTGAIVTSVLFIIGKFAISFYVSQTKVGSTYGAAGSLVILLVWIYYSSIILYTGAEFTKAYAIKYGAEIKPNDYAVTTEIIEKEKGSQSIQKKESLQKKNNSG